jgi:formylglycine-generating enzyme required for sulfatase activity
VVEGEADKARGPVQRVVRGGAWDLPADASRGAGRTHAGEDQVQRDVGFRCAQQLEKK